MHVGVEDIDIPVMASYDDGTCPCLFTLLDEIRFGETLPFVCRLELLSEIVVADGTGVDHGVWREHVLRGRYFLTKTKMGRRQMWSIQLHLEQHFALHHRRRRLPGVL
jgi:hypothetical protein